MVCGLFCRSSGASGGRCFEFVGGAISPLMFPEVVRLPLFAFTYGPRPDNLGDVIGRRGV